jgi:hypothetical protein
MDADATPRSAFAPILDDRRVVESWQKRAAALELGEKPPEINVEPERFARRMEILIRSFTMLMAVALRSISVGGARLAQEGIADKAPAATGNHGDALLHRVGPALSYARRIVLSAERACLTCFW